MDLRTIPIEAIAVGDRFREDLGNIDELVLSIQTEGLIQPLAVKLLSDGTFTLLAGGRRLIASQTAGLTEVPVRVYPEDITNLQMRSIELMENVCRKDLTWWEQSKLTNEINKLQVEIHGGIERKQGPQEAGWSKRDTAELLGTSKSSVSSDIVLAKALEAFPELLNAKNKQEATRMLKKLHTEAIRADTARRLLDSVATTPIERVRLEIGNRYIVGDFFDKVKLVPDRSIELIEIDPPYAIDIKNLKSATSPEYNMDEYNEISMRDYPNFIQKVLDELWRVAADNCWMVFWFGPDPWFEIIYQFANAVGWRGSRLPAIWYKGRGQAINPERTLANGYEMFFYFKKGDPRIEKAGRSNCFAYSPVSPQRKIHPTERPVELMQDVLSTFAAGAARVLVPFAGSGNTLLAASNLGMQAIGYDLSDTYRNAYIERVYANKPPLYKSYVEEGVTENGQE